MRAVLYKKTPRFLEMFSLWHFKCIHVSRNYYCVCSTIGAVRYIQDVRSTKCIHTTCRITYTHCITALCAHGLTGHVTVKTFSKIGAFFCKGLPACMHIVHDLLQCYFCVVFQHKNNTEVDKFYVKCLLLYIYIYIYKIKIKRLLITALPCVVCW